MTDSNDTEVAVCGGQEDDDGRGVRGAVVAGAPSVTAVVGATDAERTAATLAALDRQIAPPGGWRTTVHLLRASPGLEELVEEWSARAPASRSVGRVGRDDPTWRRTALRLADTDVVAFVAEGAVVPPTWVFCHARTFDRPEVAAASGSVGLCWLVARPAWWTAEHDGWFGVVEVGDSALTLAPGGRLSPHNASIRRVAIGDVGPHIAIFDDETDATVTATNADTAATAAAATLTEALRRGGWFAVRVPEAPVIRQVRRDDVATTAVLRRGWAAGRRSIESAPAAGGVTLVRLRLATSEVRMAMQAIIRIRRIPRVARAGIAITGAVRLGRAASLVGRDGRQVPVR